MEPSALRNTMASLRICSPEGTPKKLCGVMVMLYVPLALRVIFEAASGVVKELLLTYFQSAAPALALVMTPQCTYTSPVNPFKAALPLAGLYVIVIASELV